MADAPSPPPVFFVIVQTPGPRWQLDRPFHEQHGIIEHVEYLANYLDQGKLVMGGPFLDDAGGIVVLRTRNIEEAESIAQHDPAVRSGVLIAHVRPWLLVLSDVE
jgi:uncharacterized protein YciI